MYDHLSVPLHRTKGRVLMVQNRPILDIISHLILIFGIIIVALPIWITFVAATHDPIRMTQAPIPLLPGTYFWENFVTTLFGGGLSGTETAAVWRM